MSELSFRLSREGDVPELTRLWREVFGDDEDFISEFFRLLWRPEYCRVAEAEGKLAAMGLQTASAAHIFMPWPRRSPIAGAARRRG